MVTLVQTTGMLQNPRSMHLGNMNEMPYISTSSAFRRNSGELDSEHQKINSSKPHNHPKRMCNANVTDYQNKR